jgi:hypothetical protein
MPRAPRDIRDRFWEKVDTSGDCWLWTAATNSDGHGAFWDTVRVRRAARWLWEDLHDPIPAGHVVVHACSNASCVRPEHLQLGTVANAPRGTPPVSRTGTERSRRDRLSWEQVREIRRLAAEGSTQLALAAQFDVSRGAIRAVLSRRSWND